MKPPLASLLLLLTLAAAGCAATPHHRDATQPSTPPRSTAGASPETPAGSAVPRSELAVIACQEADMPGGGNAVPPGWIPEAPGVEALFPPGAAVDSLIQEWVPAPKPIRCHKVVFAEGTDVVGQAARVADALQLRKSDIAPVWNGSLPGGAAVAVLDRRVFVCAERTPERWDAEIRQAVGDALGPQGVDLMGGTPHRAVVESRPGRRELVLHREGASRTDALEAVGFVPGDVTRGDRPCPQRIYTRFEPPEVELHE